MYARCIIMATIAFAGGAMAVADENGTSLKPGPDVDLTVARCTICHSADYIQMDSVFLNRAGWAAEVNKMIKVMGAPITQEEASRIVAYLTHNYGVE